ncbi:glycine--tRNA ligase subunit beta [Mariprofundus sp. NF]|uniref:glycine--tRNA ligase subunit beta n=1 Tax=Mariprofundus sp. NF TaxID=2608716 RepID=UPI0015A1F496|nr:glycine--tRNA ligase subunit beta [Mariprofundus sp. NF]NWF38513.1 glycine--tRNA ligase subunit beta [Mariprofundus sp. NF]
MSALKPLLIEIGIEEIPAGLAEKLQNNLATAVDRLLKANGIELNSDSWTHACTPRRILVHSNDCPAKQPDRDETIWGPPEKVAFDADGKPTRAAEGFAKKSGLSIDDFSLEDKGDGKARYMQAVVHKAGRDVTDILGEALPDILRKLPSPKQMKWNDGETRDDAFIRPVRWIVARLGDAVIPFSYAGVSSGIESRGHRISGSVGELDLNDPITWLAEQKVMAKREDRINHINSAMQTLCQTEGLKVVADDELVEEVADLTEWPVPLLAEFGSDYLRLPEEAIRITLKAHQRCFVTHDSAGSISNKFIAVANIESKDVSKVAEGNARVVNARLADAAFYFDRDPSETLDARVEKLNSVTFQEGLGMVGDQVRRMRSFVLDSAKAIGADADAAQRAAYLCKSDLTTGLVYEFPELQGYMGGVYARMNGEPEVVAQAIAEHYQPAGAEDDLPDSPEARAIAIAERIDKLLGYFHLGRIPTASADPFGLRRAAIGLIRLLADTTQPVEMTLDQVINEAAKQWNQQRVTIAIQDETKQQVRAFIIERLLGQSDALGFSKTSMDAAVNSSETRPLYREALIARHLMGFESSEEGQAIAAANKRIANILKKAKSVPSAVETALFSEAAEQALFDALLEAEAGFSGAVSSGPFEASISPALAELAKLRGPVDQFFDDVMVMAEDEKVRGNRLALLSRLRTLFLNLADISRL